VHDHRGVIAHTLTGGTGTSGRHDSSGITGTRAPRHLTEQRELRAGEHWFARPTRRQGSPVAPAPCAAHPIADAFSAKYAFTPQTD
jgi:hypothetical protein